MRELVTIREITNITPIPGADKIVAAHVDGWVCVVKVDDFKVGDSCLYIEIDSVLPEENELFSFLMARGCKSYHCEDNTFVKGHRLKTIKLRGQVSQGLALPVPEGLDPNEDLAVQLGVKKYEKVIPASLQGMCRGNYPAWLPKTDQPRVQNLRDIPEGVFHVQEKCEGSSFTVYWDGESAGVTSRAVDLKLDQEGNAFVDLAASTGLLEYISNEDSKIRRAFPNAKIAIRGELIGPGIQGNIYGLNETQVRLFDIFVVGEFSTGYVDAHVFGVIAELVVKDLDDDRVGVVPTVDIIKLPLSREELIAMADGQSKLAPVLREGLVFKRLLPNAWGQIQSFKAISNAYLLKEKE